MINDFYKESLKDSTQKLISIQESLYDCVFRVAMVGELAEWNKTIEIGTTIRFTQDIFEACADANVQLLLKLMSEVEQTADSLININNLEL